MNWIWSRAKHRAANEIDEAALRGDVAGASTDLRLVAEAAAELRAAQSAVEPVDPPADLVRQFRAALAPVAASSATAPEKPLSSKRHSPLRPIVVLASAAVIFVGAGGALAATGSLPNALQAPVSDVVGAVGISIPDSNDSSPSSELADPAPNDPAPNDPAPNDPAPPTDDSGLDPKVEVEVAAFQDWCVNRGNKLSTKMNLATMSQACTDLVEVADNPAAITAVLTNFKAVCAEVEKFIPKKWMGELLVISDPPTTTTRARTTATTQARTTATTQARTTATTRPPTTTTRARTTATTRPSTTTRPPTTTTRARTTATTRPPTTTTRARTTATTRPPNLGGNGGNGGNGNTRPSTTTTRSGVNEDQSQAAEKAARDLKAKPEEESD